MYYLTCEVWESNTGGESVDVSQGIPVCLQPPLWRRASHHCLHSAAHPSCQGGNCFGVKTNQGKRCGLDGAWLSGGRFNCWGKLPSVLSSSVGRHFTCFRESRSAGGCSEGIHCQKCFGSFMFLVWFDFEQQKDDNDKMLDHHLILKSNSCKVSVCISFMFCTSACLGNASNWKRQRMMCKGFLKIIYFCNEA